MADRESKEIQVKDKQEVTSPAEQTRPGLVFTPDVDIFETETTITMLADLPGVRPEDLNIDLRDNTLTISGEIFPVEGGDEEDILIEYETGKYYRQFTLSEVIAQDKIDAKLTNGVLRLTLPKVEKAMPRKITVAA
ncbi:MAG: Hsp20/alpha crystallin family protein [Desulfobacteraceae bacterium]|jgi:HSP20 family molecular chaperone IbpA|nr:Hsp20/alpha crystallin family protein [Desulfobacteraceae bacterium]